MSSVSTPPSEPLAPLPPPPEVPPGVEAPPPPPRRRRSLVITGGICLLIGAGIGVATTRDASTKHQLRSTKAQLAQTRSDLRSSSRALDAARDRNNALSGEVRTARSAARTARTEARKATAQGTLPDLTGQDLGDAQSQLGDLPFDWRVKTIEQGSAKPEGTVLAQNPSSGAKLPRGQAVTLTIAKPLPQEWRTIVSLSGSGEKRTDEFRIPSGLKARLVYSFSGDDNDVIELKSPSEGGDDLGDLLFNEIGPKSGSTRLYASSGTRYLDIEGTGWSVQVQVFK